ncbi:MAG TPA: hypothetical protein VFS61_15790 [Anaerolineales bacterium]|nr:hypothetical protein [Anaerolineales bacterium]
MPLERYSHGYETKNFSAKGGKTGPGSDRKDSRFNLEGSKAIERIFGVYIDSKGLREPQKDYGAGSATSHERFEMEDQGAT